VKPADTLSRDDRSVVEEAPRMLKSRFHGLLSLLKPAETLSRSDRSVVEEAP